MLNRSRRLTPLLALAVVLGAAAEGRAQADPQNFLFSSGQTIQPFFDGWSHHPDGGFDMHFGYLNRNYVEELHIPVGAANRMAPGGPDRGQPTYFYPRTNRRVVQRDGAGGLGRPAARVAGHRQRRDLSRSRLAAARVGDLRERGRGSGRRTGGQPASGAGRHRAGGRGPRRAGDPERGGDRRRSAPRRGAGAAGDAVRSRRSNGGPATRPCPSTCRSFRRRSAGAPSAPRWSGSPSRGRNCGAPPG